MKFGVPLIVAALCWFISVIAYRWVMHSVPTSGNVVVFLSGLTVVGAVFGFIVSSAANLLFRGGPQKLRLTMSAIAWLAFVAIFVRLLVGAGADAERTLIAAGITAASGLLVGPYHAELLIAVWFVKRRVGRQSSSS